MKTIAIISLALLGGCAGMPGSYEPPHYDYGQQAIIAPGFPIERVDQPKGYTFALLHDESTDKGYANAWENGRANVENYAAGWNRREAGSSVATALFQRVDGRSVILPMEGNDGYRFVDGQRITYAFIAGRYPRVAGTAPELIPPGAPGCAYGVYLVATTNDARRRFIGTLADGVACEDLAGITSVDQQDQLERAIGLLGLR